MQDPEAAAEAAAEAEGLLRLVMSAEWPGAPGAPATSDPLVVAAVAGPAEPRAAP
jgi:hypothetical protein